MEIKKNTSIVFEHVISFDKPVTTSSGFDSIANQYMNNEASPKNDLDGSEKNQSGFSLQKKEPVKPSFLLESINYMVAHRIGIDKKRIDELKEEIKKMEGTIESLKENPTPKNLKTIEMLQSRIEALTKQLELLVKEFLEKQMDEEKKSDELERQTQM